MPLFIRYNILRRVFLNKNKKMYIRKVEKMTFLQSKKEGFLKLNKDIDLIFMNHEKKSFTKNIVNNIKDIEARFFTKSLIFFYLKKIAFLSKFNNKVQYFYFIYNLISTYSITLNNLIRNEIFSFDNLLYNTNFKFIITKKLFINKWGRFLNNNEKENTSSVVWAKYSGFFSSIFFKKYYTYLVTTNKYNSCNFFPLLTSLDSSIAFNNLNYNKNILNKKKLLLRKELISTLLGRNTDWNKFLKNTNWISFLFERLISNKNNVNINVWKYGKVNAQKEYNKEINNNFFYFLLRLEEKLKNISYSVREKETILALRNLYLKKLYSKVNRKVNKGYVLSTLSFLEKLGRSLNKRKKKYYAISISKKKTSKNFN